MTVNLPFLKIQWGWPVYDIISQNIRRKERPEKEWASLPYYHYIVIKYINFLGSKVCTFLAELFSQVNISLIIWVSILVVLINVPIHLFS